MSDYKYSLIMTICSGGFAEEVVASAKGAGAYGGTILHGKGSASNEIRKFFGITIHPDKEIILIVTSVEKKTEIMKAIATNHGITSEARAICFSVPVDDIAGIKI